MGSYSTATLLLLLCTTITTFAARTSKEGSVCASKCPDATVPRFPIGQSLTYDYQAETEIKSKLGNYDSTRVKIISKVTVTAVSSCDLKMTMTAVEVFDQNSKTDTGYQSTPNRNEMKQALEKNDIYFSVVDNNVESVCTSSTELIWVENMKKNIIDQVANKRTPKMKQMTSNGLCKVNAKERYNEITVEYDIRYCSNSNMVTGFFDDIAINKFLDSNVKCDYVYDKNLVKMICTENYEVTPTKTNQNQLLVKIVSNLKRTSVSTATDLSVKAKDVVKSTIEQRNEAVYDQFTIQEVQETLKKICKATNSKIPDLFMNLVNQLKTLNAKEIQELYRDVEKSDMCSEKPKEIRSVFYDAIGFVNNPEAVSVMVDLIRTKKVSEVDQGVWFTSLSYLPTPPSNEMIGELETLVDPVAPISNMYLGISAATRLFCQRNYEACQSSSVIQKLTTKFLQPLDTVTCTPKDDEQLSKMLLSLRALGNMRFYDKKIVASLSNCAASKTAPTSVRVAAIEVMKHMGCENDRSAVLAMMENTGLDSELRINAYLAVMGCPDIDTNFRVLGLLRKEKVNQVGSFIWTHLTNIQESGDPLKISIKLLLKDVQLKKIFDLSKLKYSRNIEKTFQIGSDKTTLDSNVIFSEKSFLPRSVSFNSTATILGSSHNVLEVNSRFEGVEEMLFKLLGPDGYLKQGKKNKAEDNVEMIKLLNAVSGSVDLKLFGQQISFIEFIRGSLGSIRKYNILQELMSLGDARKLVLSKRMVLADRSTNLATVQGLPLQLALQASAAFNIRLESRLDAAALMQWPLRLDGSIDISPEIAAQLQADVALVLPAARYGMRLQLRSLTDTTMRVSVLARPDQELSIRLDTPNSAARTAQELLTVAGEAFLVYRTSTIPQLQQTLIKRSLCSPASMERVLGVRVCADASIADMKTRDSALLMAPFSGSLRITKTDSQTGYLLRLVSATTASSMPGKRPDSKLYRLELDTPGSRLYRRRNVAELSLNFERQSLRLELDSPLKQFLVEANYRLTGPEKRFGIKMQLDRRDVLTLMSEHATVRRTKRTTVTGGLSVNVLHLSPMSTHYQLQSTNNHWSFEFKSQGIMKKPTTLNLRIVKAKSTRQLSLYNKYKISGSYDSALGSGSISGIANDNYYGHRWDVKVVHDETLKLIFRHKTEDKSSKTLMKYFLTSSVAFGPNAENFFSVHSENEMSQRHVRTLMKTTYGHNGPDPKKKFVEEIKTHLYGGYTWKKQNLHAEGSLNFKFPSRGINYDGRYSSEMGHRVIKMMASLDSMGQPRVSAHIDFRRPKLYLKDTEFQVKLLLPERVMALKWSLREVDVNKYEYTLRMGYNAHTLLLQGVQTQISALRHSSELTVTLPRSLSSESIPESVRLRLDLGLEDLSDVSLLARLEVPGTETKYELDAGLSLNSRNLMRTAGGPVLKYSIKLQNGGARIISTALEFVCQPKQFMLMVQLSPRSEQEKMALHLLASQENPNYKQVNSKMEAALTLLGGTSYKAVLISEFRYSSMQAQLQLEATGSGQLQQKQQVSVTCMYELENSWSQKGLVASLTLRTPWEGWRMTHLGVNAVGQLRYRKVDVELQYGRGDKLSLSLVMQPRSANDFSVTVKLVTPWAGMRLISGTARLATSATSVNSELKLELGASHRLRASLEAADNSNSVVRDLSAVLTLDSDFVSTGSISLSHKDDSIRYQSVAAAKYGPTVFITLASDVSLSLMGRELLTNGNVKMFSSVPAIKLLQAKWAAEHSSAGLFMGNIDLSLNSDNLLQTSLKGFYEFDSDIDGVKADANGLMRLANYPAIKLSGDLVGNFLSWKMTTRALRNNELLYSHLLQVNKDKTLYTVEIPASYFKTIEWCDHIARKGANQVSRKSWLKYGSQFVYKLMSKHIVLNKPNRHLEIESKIEFYSDYVSPRKMELQGDVKYNPTQTRVTMLLTDAEKKQEMGNVAVTVVTPDEARKTNTDDEWKLLFSTKLNKFGEYSAQLEHRPRQGRRPMRNLVVLTLNKYLRLRNLVEMRGRRYINLETTVQDMFFKLKHDEHMMGFTDSAETNLFGFEVKYLCSYESRGGSSFYAKLESDHSIYKSVNILRRASRFDHQLDFITVFKNPDQQEEMMKIQYRKQGSLLTMGIETKRSGSGQLKVDLNTDKKTILLKGSYPSIFELNMNYNGDWNSMKHSNDLLISWGESNQKLSMKTRLEKVKWNYLLFSTELDSNIQQVLNSKFGVEYRLRPSNLETEISAFCNDKFLKLQSKFIKEYKDKAVKLAIESSFAPLKEAILEIKYKLNEKQNQYEHKFKTSVNSYERKFLLENKLEFVGLKFAELVIAMEVKTDTDVYMIEPRSLSMKHSWQGNDLRDNLAIEMGKDRFVKMEIATVKHESIEVGLEYSMNQQSFQTLFSGDIGKSLKTVSLLAMKNGKVLLKMDSSLRLDAAKTTFQNSLRYGSMFSNDLDLSFMTGQYESQRVQFGLKNSMLNRPVLATLDWKNSGKTVNVKVNDIKGSWVFSPVTGFHFSAEVSKYGSALVKYIVTSSECTVLVTVHNKKTNLLMLGSSISANKAHIKGNYKLHMLDIMLDRENLAAKVIIDIKNFVINTAMNGRWENGEKSLTVTGSSNCAGMKLFKAECLLSTDKEEGLRQLTSSANVNNKLLFSVDLKNGITEDTRSMEFRSDLLATERVSLVLLYNPKTVKGNLRFESIYNDQKITLNVNIDKKGEISGSLMTPFDGWKSTRVIGKLEGEHQEGYKGSFSLNGDFEKPIEGEILYRKSSEELSMTLVTPFLESVNRVSLVAARDSKQLQQSLQLDVDDLTVLQCIQKWGPVYEAELKLALPKSIKELDGSVSVSLDTRSTLKRSVRLVLQSSVYPHTELYAEAGKDEQHEGGVKATLNLKSESKKIGSLRLATSARSVSIVSECNGWRHGLSAELKPGVAAVHSWRDLAGDLTMWTTDSKLELAYKHSLKINDAQVGVIGKFNGDRFFSWQSNMQRTDSSIMASLQLMLKPDNVELENLMQFEMKTDRSLGLIVRMDRVLSKEVVLQVTRPMMEDSSQVRVVLSSPWFRKLDLELSKSDELYKLLLTADRKSVCDIQLKWTQQQKQPGAQQDELELVLAEPINVRATVSLDQGAKPTLTVRVDVKEEKVAELSASKIGSGGFNIKMQQTGEFLPLLLPRDAQLSLVLGPRDIFVLKGILDSHFVTLKAHKTESTRISVALQSSLPGFESATVSLSKTKQPNEYETTLTWNKATLTLTTTISRSTGRYSASLSQNLLPDHVMSAKQSIVLELGTKLSSLLVVTDSQGELIVANYKRGRSFELHSRLWPIPLRLTLDQQARVGTLMIMSDNTFMLTMARPTPRSLDMQLSLHGVIYRTQATWEPPRILELQVDAGSQQLLHARFSTLSKPDKKALDMALVVGARELLRLKMTTSSVKGDHKRSGDMRVLGIRVLLDIVTDTAEANQRSLKLSWNVRTGEQQQTVQALGSLVLSSRSTTPINYSASLNMQSGSYAMQLMQLDNKDEYRVTLASPHRGWDLQASWLNRWSSPDRRIVVCRWSASNSVLGSFTLRTNLGLLGGDFKLTTGEKMKNLLSVQAHFNPVGPSFTSEVCVLDWEPAFLKATLSTTGPLHALELRIKTPVKAARSLHFSQSMHFTGWLEHKHRVSLRVEGAGTKFDVSGEHEISWIRRKFTLDGKLLHRELEIVSVTVRHTGEHASLSHSVLWRLRQSAQYGYLLRGRFTPLFEGRAELHTPHTRTGKMVLLLERSQTRTRLEADDGSGSNEEPLSLESTTGSSSSSSSSSGGVETTEIERRLKLVLPRNYAVAPIELKYSVSRTKRSLNSQLIYGTRRLLELDTKISSMDKNKYAGTFKIRVPHLSEKEVELSLSHEMTTDSGGGGKFEHSLKLDSDEPYRLFGSLQQQREPTLGSPFSAELGCNFGDLWNLGELRLRAGHSWQPSGEQRRHVSELVLSHNGEPTGLDYSGVVELSSSGQDGSSYSGDWRLGSLRLQATHASSANNDQVTCSASVTLRGELILATSMTKGRSKNRLSGQIGCWTVQTRFDSGAAAKQAQLTVACPARQIFYRVKANNKQPELRLEVSSEENKSLGLLVINYSQSSPWSVRLELGPDVFVAASLALDPELKTLRVGVSANLPGYSVTVPRDIQLAVSRNEAQLTVQLTDNDKKLILAAEYDYGFDKGLDLELRCHLRDGVQHRAIVMLRRDSVRLVVNEHSALIQVRAGVATYSASLGPVRNAELSWSGSEQNRSWLVRARVDDLESSMSLRLEPTRAVLELKTNWTSVPVQKLQLDASVSSVETDKMKKMWRLGLKWDDKKQLEFVIVMEPQLLSFGMDTSNLEEQHSMLFLLNREKKELLMSVQSGSRFVRVRSKLQLSELVQNDKRQLLHVLESSVNSSCKRIGELKHTVSYTEQLDGRRALTVRNDLDWSGIKVGAKLELVSNKIAEMAVWWPETLYSVRMEHRLAAKHWGQYKLIVSLPHGRQDISVVASPSELIVVHNGETVTRLRYRDDQNRLRLDWYGTEIVNVRVQLQQASGSVVLEMKRPLRWQLVLTNQFDKTSNARTLEYKFESSEPGVPSSGVKLNYKKTATGNIVMWQLSVTNDYHVLSIGSSKDETELSLTNRADKRHWRLIMSTFSRSMWRVVIQMPGEPEREVRYSSSSDAVELQVLDLLRLSLQRKTASDLMAGSVWLMGHKIASVSKSSQVVQLVLNEDGKERERISMSLSVSEEGRWMRDYRHTCVLRVRQPALNIDCTATKKLLSSSTSYEQSLIVTYKLADGQQQRQWNWQLAADWTSPNRVVVRLATPVWGLWRMEAARERPAQGELLWRVEVVSGDDRHSSVSARLHLVLSGNTPGVICRVSAGQHSAQAHLRYLDPRQLELRAFVTSSGSSIRRSNTSTTLLLMQARLINERQLDTTFQVRLDAANDMLRLYGKLSTDVSHEMFQKLLSIRSAVNDEMVARYHQLSTVLPNDTMQQLRNFYRTTAVNLESLSHQFTDMAVRDEFYITSITNGLSRTFISAMYVVPDLLRSLTRSTTQLIYKIRNFFFIICEPFSQLRSFLHETLRTVCHYINSGIKSLLSWRFPLILTRAANGVQYVCRLGDRFLRSLVARLSFMRRLADLKITEKLYHITSRFSVALKNNYRGPLATMTQFLLDETTLMKQYDAAISWLELSSRSLIARVEAISRPVEATLGRSEYLSGLLQMTSALGNELVRQLRDKSNQALLQQWVSDEIESRVSRLPRQLTSLTMDLVWPRLLLVRDNSFSPSESGNYRLNVVYTSPLPMHDLQSFPDTEYAVRKLRKLRAAVTSARSMITNQLSSGRRMSRTLLWFTPSLAGSSRLLPSIPDFWRYATLTSESVAVTFDKQSLRLVRPGQCSMLLAEDGLRGQWSVSMTSTATGARVVAMRVGDRQLRITSEHRVSVDNKPLELPAKVGQLMIVARAGILSLRDENGGWSLTLDADHSLLTLGISGWYHGKTRGLFGNADNEPANDLRFVPMTTHKDCRVRHLHDPASGSGLAVPATAAAKDKSCPFLRKLVCKFLFRCPLSPMSACFPTVDPTKFLTACMSGSSSSGKQQDLQPEMDSSVCSAASNYQAQCHAHGVKVPLPLPCRKCSAPSVTPRSGGGVLRPGESVRIKLPEKTADVVMVLEEGRCISETRDGAAALLEQLQRSMEARSLTGVRFGLVGFSGSDVTANGGENSAHSHTVKQTLLWPRAADAAAVVRQMVSLSSASSDRNTEKALRLALRYPFRPHASRHIILVPCGPGIGGLSSKMKSLFEQRAAHFSVARQLPPFASSGTVALDAARFYSLKQPRNGTARPGGSEATAAETTSGPWYELAMARDGLIMDTTAMGTASSTLAELLSRRASPARVAKCSCLDQDLLVCRPVQLHPIFPAKKSD